MSLRSIEDVDIDVTTETFADFAAANRVDFHNGDKLKMDIWVGNNSTMERLAEIQFTGGGAEVLIGHDIDGDIDMEHDTFLLEAVIEGLQRELLRRERANYDELPDDAKRILAEASAAFAAGRGIVRPERTAGICCVASRDGGEHDHDTFTIDV